MSNDRKKPGCGGSSGQIQGHPTQQEIPYRQIRDQLADVLFQSEDEEIDIEALSSLLDRLEQVDPYPGVLDAEKSLKRFHQQNAAVFDAVESGRTVELPLPARKKKGRPSFAKVAVIAAALILLLCTTAQAFSLDVFSAIARWTSEVFSLGTRSASYASVQNNPLAEGETAYFSSLEEAVAAFGIEAPIVPKWIPERFELESVTASSWHSGVAISASYVCKGDYLYVEYREISGQNLDIVELEYKDVFPHWAGGMGHYLIVDNGREKASWTNGDFECQVHGTVSRQELEDIIDSIY